jgi:urease accessory protein UreE
MSKLTVSKVDRERGIITLTSGETLRTRPENATLINDGDVVTFDDPGLEFENIEAMNAFLGGAQTSAGRARGVR